MKISSLITIALTCSVLCSCTDRDAEDQKKQEARNVELEARIEALTKQLENAQASVPAASAESSQGAPAGNAAEKAEPAPTVQPEPQKPKVETIRPSKAMMRLAEYGILDYQICKLGNQYYEIGKEERNALKEHFSRYSNGDEDITDFPFLATIIFLANVNNKDCPKSCILSFIEAGADVNQKGEYGAPLLLACKGGNSAVIELLLERGASGINDKSPSSLEKGTTPLIYASKKGAAKAVKLLLEAGADVDVTTPTGMTAIIAAGEIGDAETIRLLLEADADVNATTQNGWTAIIAAGGSGNTEAIKLLLEAGADVNARDKNCQTALLCAIREKHVESVKILLEAGAKVGHAEKTYAADRFHYDPEIIRLMKAAIAKQQSDTTGDE